MGVRLVGSEMCIRDRALHLWRVVADELSVVLLRAFRTYSVREDRFRVLAYVLLKDFPFVMLADLLTEGTDRKQPLQHDKPIQQSPREPDRYGPEYKHERGFKGGLSPVDGSCQSPENLVRKIEHLIARYECDQNREADQLIRDSPSRKVPLATHGRSSGMRRSSSARRSSGIDPPSSIQWCQEGCGSNPVQTREPPLGDEGVTGRRTPPT